MSKQVLEFFDIKDDFEFDYSASPQLLGFDNVGAKGDTGAQGDKGDKGDKGDTGDTGAQGANHLQMSLKNGTPIYDLFGNIMRIDYTNGDYTTFTRTNTQITTDTYVGAAHYKSVATLDTGGNITNINKYQVS